MAVQLSELKFPYKFNGMVLTPTIIQSSVSGLVLSLFYADAGAISRSLADGHVWRYSREHNRMMKKGEESGNTQKIVDVFANQNRESVLMRVIPAGPACHLGYESCFFTQPLKDLKFPYCQGGTYLLPAIVQDLVTKDVLDLNYMNREALEKSKATDALWVYEKGRVMKKEKKSEMIIFDIIPDCDKDAVLASVIPSNRDVFWEHFHFTEKMV